MYMFKKIAFVLFLILVLSCVVSCVSYTSQDQALIASADSTFKSSGIKLDEEDRKIIPHIEVVSSDTMKIISPKNFEKSMYVYVRNNTQKDFDFKHNLEAKLEDLGFKIVQKPSLAEYIMLLDIIAMGQANALSITKAVAAQDKAELDLEGADANFLIFDLALVLRESPKGNKPDSAVIRLSSMRSVKEHSTLRIALIYKLKDKPKNRVFEHVIITEIIVLIKNSK